MVETLLPAEAVQHADTLARIIGTISWEPPIHLLWISIRLSSQLRPSKHLIHASNITVKLQMIQTQIESLCMPEFAELAVYLGWIKQSDVELLSSIPELSIVPVKA